MQDVSHCKLSEYQASGIQLSTGNSSQDMWDGGVLALECRRLKARRLEG